MTDVNYHQSHKMICSNCGQIIAETDEPFMVKDFGKGEEVLWFNTMDSSWTCNHCNEIWYSSDGWYTYHNILIPVRG